MSNHKTAWAWTEAAWTRPCRCSDTPWRVWVLPEDQAHRWRPTVLAKGHQGVSDLQTSTTNDCVVMTVLTLFTCYCFRIFWHWPVRIWRRICVSVDRAVWYSTQMLHTFWTSAESTRFPPTGFRMFLTEADFWNARLKRSVNTEIWQNEKEFRETKVFHNFISFRLILLTGRLFCEVLGCGGGGVGSWLSSFLDRTSLKSVRMTETPQRYWSCLVTSGIDSFRLQGKKQRKLQSTVK